MLRPLFRLAANEPQLLADHVEAYAALAAGELRSASALWQRRLALRLLGAAGLTVGVLLAGVALLLWAVTPLPAIDKPGLLLAVPVFPGVFGAWAWWRAAATPPADQAFAALRRQWAADAAMLREAGV